MIDSIKDWFKRTEPLKDHPAVARARDYLEHKDETNETRLEDLNVGDQVDIEFYDERGQRVPPLHIETTQKEDGRKYWRGKAWGGICEF